MVAPWIKDGVPIYSVALPDGAFWIFTSTRPREEVKAWLQARDLSIHSIQPLPAGMPRP